MTIMRSSPLQDSWPNINHRSRASERDETELASLLKSIPDEYRTVVDAIADDSDFTHAEKIELITRWKPIPRQESKKRHEEVLIARVEKEASYLDFKDEQRQHRIYPEAFDKKLQLELQRNSEVEGLTRATRLRAANIAHRESSYPEAFRHVPRRKSRKPRISDRDYNPHGTRGFHMARLEAEEDLPPDGLEDALLLSGRQTVRERLKPLIGLAAPLAISHFS